tara:strand:+ start:9762 stop:10283 length:522 start_codon:yes stop_codon:yes gene_type:complete
VKDSCKHIFLIGMMGSGKSSVGITLSQKLNLPHIDTDEDLMDILNLDMTQIFEDFSEKRFRALESTYFLKHIKNDQNVYSTGGGIILNSKNRAMMNEFGKTILLKSSISNLYSRLKNDTKNIRPLFQKNNTKKNLQKIWNDRKVYYKECADYIIKVDNKSINKISNEIIKKLN